MTEKRKDSLALELELELELEEQPMKGVANSWKKQLRLA
jgi:hypothetical protein